MSLHRKCFQIVFCSVLFAGIACAQSMDVTVQVEVTRLGKGKIASGNVSSGVAIWFNAVASDSADSPAVARSGHFRLTQKNKSFIPHLLIVPLGSSVDFPNLDPFFHNVFSQFNGKRFDLGLYEAGSTRTVHFDHEGVSYIFCNIHPEMSAVVISLATPYVAISPENGHVILHNVPVGTYDMKVWAEGVEAKQLDNLSRRIHISASSANLDTIHLVKDEGLTLHKNKFGEDYKPDKSIIY